MYLCYKIKNRISNLTERELLEIPSLGHNKSKLSLCSSIEIIKKERVMREKFYAIMLLVFLFVVMPAVGYMTNADYFGHFIAQLGYYGHGTTATSQFASLR